MSTDNPLIYFCGVWPGSRAGHYDRLPGGHRPPRNAAYSPWGSYGYPLLDWHPDRNGTSVAAQQADKRPRWQRSPYTDTEGVFKHLVVDGWTMLAAWDRSGDDRMASTATFAIHDEMFAAEALAYVRTKFPTVLERIENHVGHPVTVEAFAAGMY